MGKILVAISIIGGLINLAFAVINYYKVNKLYKNPNDPNAQKALKDIRQFAITALIVFSIVALGDIIGALVKDKKKSAIVSTA
jgi:hypothetical protein